MSQIANPLYYPIAVLFGGLILVVGVRFLGIPNLIILPTSIAIATAGATVLKFREPDPNKMILKQLEQELQTLKITSQSLAQKAELLRQESEQLLAHDHEDLELLIKVQEVCNQTIELPVKIEEMAKRLPQTEALLSVGDLEQEIQKAKTKLNSSSGIARQQLEELIQSLERNIQLARTGQDTRQAKIVSLQKMIQDSAGILQQMQNKMRTEDLRNSQTVEELQDLSNELNNFQNNVDLLIKE